MITLSYGFKKPQTGDKGSVFWPALEQDIQLLNDHTHNGVNSAKITAASISPVKLSLSSADWVSQGGGVYRMDVELANGQLYADCTITIKNASSGDAEIMYMHIEEATDPDHFYIFSNDNTINLTAYVLT